MSPENMDVVRRLADVTDREGFEAAFPLLAEVAHPDVMWREDPT